MTESITGKLMAAGIAEDKKGIVIRIRTSRGDVICEYRIGEEGFIIPEGQNAEEEMQKVCDLLTGYQTKDGVRDLIPGFQQKTITIIREEEK